MPLAARGDIVLRGALLDHFLISARDFLDLLVARVSPFHAICMVGVSVLALCHVMAIDELI